MSTYSLVMIGEIKWNKSWYASIISKKGNLIWEQWVTVQIKEQREQLKMYRGEATTYYFYLVYLIRLIRPVSTNIHTQNPYDFF